MNMWAVKTPQERIKVTEALCWTAKHSPGTYIFATLKGLARPWITRLLIETLYDLPLRAQCPPWAMTPRHCRQGHPKWNRPRISRPPCLQAYQERAYRWANKYQHLYRKMRDEEWKERGTTRLTHLVACAYSLSAWIWRSQGQWLLASQRSLPAAALETLGWLVWGRWRPNLHWQKSMQAQQIVNLAK